MRVFLEKAGKSIELKPQMAQLFYRECKRTKFWGYFFRSRKGFLEGVSADLKITIEYTPNKKKELFIHSRAVLYDPKRNRSYQFYFGLLLIEWYRDSTKP